MSEEFDFELNRVARVIAERNVKTALLQFPEGLKRQALKVKGQLVEKVPKCDIKISGEPCYGACDIPKTSDTELIVNFGHLPIPNLANVKDVIFIQARSEADPLPAVKEALPRLGGRVGIVTTAQHIHKIPEITELLESQCKVGVVGKGDDRIFSEGQLLGCNVSSAKSIEDKVDNFLFVGSGDFHPLAVAIATSKEVIIADSISSEVREISELKDKVLRQRFGAIATASHAKSFGIIVSTKPGQRREELAKDIEVKLKEANRDTLIVEMENITPAKLDAFGLDVWVSTACPRIAIDDHARFTNPILTPAELEIMLGQMAWENYLFDTIT